MPRRAIGVRLYRNRQGTVEPIRLAGSGGSSIADDWKHLREAGATARWLLVQAAARDWNLPADKLRTESGQVIAADGRKLTYGALARSAASIASPDQAVKLKNPEQFRIIGKPTRTADARDIVTGRSHFGIDEYAADALVVVIARCPLLDGTLDTFDDHETRKVAGVKDVIALAGPKPDEPFSGPLAAGVAVLAENTWAALQGREKLKVTWKPGPWTKESSGALAGGGEQPAQWQRRRRQRAQRWRLRRGAQARAANHRSALRDAVPGPRHDGAAGGTDRDQAGQRAPGCRRCETPMALRNSSRD